MRLALLLSLAATARLAVAAGAIVPGAYIFEFEENQDPKQVYSEIERQGSTRFKLEYQLFKGVSVQLRDPETAPIWAARIAAMPQVKAAFPLKLYDMPKPRVDWVASELDRHAGSVWRRDFFNQTMPANGTFSPHAMTQVDLLRKRGFTGRGVRIAVIDTGIDYKHPALGGCFGKGCLVSFGTDLVGDAYTGNNTAHPGPDPMDCAGHGTHVAGIVAAQPNKFGFTGVAPDASLGAYRVFGCKGQVGNDVLIAAYNQAYQDGADIITASIGGPSGWSEDPWAVAVERIVEKGVPCTVSAGNEGSEGVFYASGAADGKKVTAVASFDNTQTPVLLYRVAYSLDGGEDRPFGYVPGVPGAWTGVTLEAYATTTNPEAKDDACSPLPDSTPDLSRRIVLIRRGTCNFAQKAMHAAAKGARYMLVYNNVGGALSIDVSDVPQMKAAGMVTRDVGDKLVGAIRGGSKVTLKMASRNQTSSFIASETNNVTGGALSTFTSWGPTWEMDLKPQVGAPGGNILSTFPRAKGSYAVLSGTSMSCPLMAGIMALIGQVRGTFEPALLENLLSSSAKPQLFNDGNGFADSLAPAAQQGGGLVQAYDAAYATTLIEPSGLSFNDTDHFVDSLEFRIRNVGRRGVTYKLSHVPALTVYTLAAKSIYPDKFPNEGVTAAATIELSDTEISLRPGEHATIEVEASPPPGLDARRLALWSGWVAINGSDGSSLSIPYQGLTGSLHDSPVLAAKGTWMARSQDEELEPTAPNTTFAIPPPGRADGSSDLPALVATMALGSSTLRADIMPIKKKGAGAGAGPGKAPKEDVVKAIGQPYGFPMRWVTRGNQTFPWDGRLDSGNYAPPGEYKFVVKALRIFGDADDESEYDVSESPSFSIEYK